MERQRSQMRTGDGWRKPMHRPSKSQGGAKMNTGQSAMSMMKRTGKVLGG